MDRIINCVKFQANRYLKTTIVFTAIFLISYFAIVAMLLLAEPEGSMYMGYYVMALIFAFLTPGILYKDTFNNLMLFSNTRKTITASMLLCTVAFSALLAVLSELGELLNLGMCRIFNSLISSSIDNIYRDITTPQKLLWFFTLFLMVVLIGNVYGAFNYKFGKMFKAFFWGGFGVLMMLSSLLSNGQVYIAVSNAAKWFFGYQMVGGANWCSLHFFIVAVVLGAILWLLARRQPQNA